MDFKSQAKNIKMFFIYIHFFHMLFLLRPLRRKGTGQPVMNKSILISAGHHLGRSGVPARIVSFRRAMVSGHRSKQTGTSFVAHTHSRQCFGFGLDRDQDPAKNLNKDPDPDQYPCT
jgi:hypothetical protein